MRVIWGTASAVPRGGDTQRPIKTKKPPVPEMRRTTKVLRGTTQIALTAPLTAQKSPAPLTLRLRAVLTKARAACSGAIGRPPPAAASHLSRLSESIPRGPSPSSLLHSRFYHTPFALSRGFIIFYIEAPDRRPTKRAPPHRADIRRQGRRRSRPPHAEAA